MTARPGPRIGILGAGRQALETGGYCAELGLGVAFFAEEPAYARAGMPEPDVFGAPICSLDEELDFDLPVITAVGSAAVRRRFVASWGGHEFSRVISAHAWLARDVSIGAGTTVAPLASVNRLVQIGSHVLVNVHAVLSHDVTIGDFATISPGACIGGGVGIGDDAFIGIGATVRDHVWIGNGAVVGAGAVVVRDVPDGQTVVGVPARPLTKLTERCAT